MMIIWYIVPEISSTIDRLFVILDYFWPFYPLATRKIKILKNEKNYWRYYHFKHEYHEWKSWCMIPEIWSTADIIFCFGPFFALLHPPNKPENQNFEKRKKTPGDIIILPKCTINDNHTIYGSWNMKCTRQNSFVILGHIFPLLPSNSL